MVTTDINLQIRQLAAETKQRIQKISKQRESEINAAYEEYRQKVAQIRGENSANSYTGATLPPPEGHQEHIHYD